MVDGFYFKILLEVCMFDKEGAVRLPNFPLGVTIAPLGFEKVDAFASP